MYNKKWKKLVAIIAVAGVLASVPGNPGYAQEMEHSEIEGKDMSSSEIVEKPVEENNEIVVSENESNSSLENDQESKSNNIGNDLSSEKTEEIKVSDMLTPSEAEKNAVANSWRFKDGERIIQESPVPNAKSGKAITPWTNINGKFYNTRGEVIEGVVAKGIDVSQWNGDIDWATVKNTDVDYAIIRCGYGQDQTDQDDPKWKRNADACTQYNIPFGVYLYSYADTVEKAKSEAQHVLRLVKGYDLAFPIYYDLEEQSVRDSVSTSKIAQIAKAFCDTIEAAGYRVSIYANTDWFTNYLTDPMFDNWNKWVAQYNYQCTYAGSYTMWQCTSKGSVNGISGYVDLNMDFGTADIKRLVVKDGKTYCYSGTKQLFGEQKVDGSWYYFAGQTGEMYTGFYVNAEKGKTVYYGPDGVMRYGEQKIDGKWYCFAEGTGAMYTGFYVNAEKGKTVYYGPDGAMRYGEQKIDGKWYCFAEGTGAMYTGFYVNAEKGKTVYYGPDGAMWYGEQKIDGKWYCFAEGTGAMNTGFYKNTEKEKTVYYGIDGAMLYGWQVIEGKKYYFHTSTGAMQYGEQKIDGKWYCFAEETGAMNIGFYKNKEKEKTVYYGTDGAMLYGWQVIEGKKYYFHTSTGAMQYGEQKIDGKWYCFGKDTGIMNTGFYKNEDKNKTVYYDSTGAMQYGEQKIDGKWYYFIEGTGAMHFGFYNNVGKDKTVYYGTDGSMQYGEQKIDGKWYCFERPTGAMARNKTVNGHYYGYDGVRVY